MAQSWAPSHQQAGGQAGRCQHAAGVIQQLSGGKGVCVFFLRLQETRGERGARTTDKKQGATTASNLNAVRLCSTV